MVQIDYRYLRPKKAAALQKWHEEPFLRREELNIWQGANATILPLRQVEGDELLFGRGGVVDEHGDYVSLSAIPRRVQDAYPFESAPFRDEKVVYCGYLVHHWGHFLVEAVARLWYFLEQDPSIDKYVFFLKENEEREIRGNYRMFLELLGIWDRLEFISRPTTYREVLVPELGFDCRRYYSPKFLAVFDAIAGNVKADPGWEPLDRIFFSRSRLQKGSGNGYEFGFEILDDFYSRNGYTILYPERVPLDQMIYLIRHSQEVAAVSGTLPHNMLFAAPEQKVVILERCVMNNDYQVNVNRMKELHVTYVDSNIGLYTVDMCGPFIMGYNAQMQRYAEGNGMVPPDQGFTSKKHLDRCFKQYMRSYRDQYRYRWHMEDWYAEFTDYLLEAYQEGESYFGDFLNGSRPFFPEHYFMFHYWKQLLKRILIRLGLFHQ